MPHLTVVAPRGYGWECIKTFTGLRIGPNLSLKSWLYKRLPVGKSGQRGDWQLSVI